jgi:hypothetical protein
MDNIWYPLDTEVDECTFLDKAGKENEQKQYPAPLGETEPSM